ncbi:unnamed protein product [Meganyctiphanes norvegica]|uniref:MYND-type domain-containing protein n=1 Tax=Meganyctiphanes norvegica TaxID=48144 RepID=A0AAV2R425_MEGNR
MSKFVHGVNYKEQVQQSMPNVRLTEEQKAHFEQYARSITPAWMIEPSEPFSYNNTQNLKSCPELVQVKESSIQQGYHISVYHYLGTCHYCYEEPTEEAPLKRCAKCQVVAYCSVDCQTVDWKSHKVFCKVLPLRVGRDEIRTYRPFKVGHETHKDLIKDLFVRCQRLVLIKKPQNQITLGIDQLARQCQYPGCYMTIQALLHCCKCLQVSYCSLRHQENDIAHFEICSKSYIKINSYCRNNSTLSIQYMSAYPASNEYRPISGGKKQIAENIISEITQAVVTNDNVLNKWTETQVQILSDRLAMPFTILYCLQKFGVGQLSTPLAEVTSLNVHILTALPLFDPQMWELLLHRLPALKELNITYIGCAGLNWHPNNVHSTMIKFERCGRCKKDDRVVSIKVLLKHYHMYFSSDDYVEPDVVAIVGYNKKLLDTKSIEKDDVNELTSRRNMTYNKDTLVIATDYEIFCLDTAIEEMNNARPINVLMPVTENPLHAEGHFDSMRVHGKRYNLLKYLTCMQRK